MIISSLCVCMCVCVYICIHAWCPKEVSESLKLELQAAGSCHVSSGDGMWVFCGSSKSSSLLSRLPGPQSVFKILFVRLFVLERTGEMSQLVNCLVYRHEDLGLDH